MNSITIESKTNMAAHRSCYDKFSKNSKSKYCENLNALVVGKMNDEINSITIKQFFGLNSIMHSMYSILVSNSSEHQKSKGCI